ncbi:MAG: sigma-70 family RNA polymerase sigma factor [Ruminococcaceae bacterium]|nr:sigma-70 family RNA polymerase sigma factor [Oscillospiraceae bacterium]
MNRQDAEKIITEYLKPIFGFALKRCKNMQDAEDLSQEIVLKAFRALLIKDDIGDTNKFIWTVAHNALSNYYRDTAGSMIGVSIDEMAEILSDPDSLFAEDDNSETICRLQSEIAYLSKLQRKIVIAYYFENRKQADIAKDLGIPLGTVKWHLFEAKKELKKGMDIMRKTSELKFNPIKFNSFGINGSIGTKSTYEFFRSALVQNICYCVRNEAKTVHEIADALGVSPVYVENEVEYLAENGFLKEEKDKYIVNFIISEPTAEFLTMQDAMYKKAAGLFAGELYDELVSSGILDDESILGNYMLPNSTREKPLRDHNFLLWSLIPYIAAISGEKLMDNTITFEEVATIRPDGAHNIAYATVLPEHMNLPNDYVYMKDWCGPMTNGYGGQYMLWCIDTEWSDREKHRGAYPIYDEVARRILSLYDYEKEAILSKEDYAWLSEHGYIKTWGDYDKVFKTAWQIVILANKEIKEKLLAIGEKLKAKYKDEFDALKAPYVEAVLASVPAHLRKAKAYELQFVFHSDGWFLLHCIVSLLNSGKLKLPTEEQRKSLTTLIVPNM